MELASDAQLLWSIGITLYGFATIGLFSMGIFSLYMGLKLLHRQRKAGTPTRWYRQPYILLAIGIQWCLPGLVINTVPRLISDSGLMSLLWGISLICWLILFTIFVYALYLLRKQAIYTKTRHNRF